MTEIVTAIGSWSPAVLVLGENRPRIVHRAELVLEHDVDGFRYAVHWWVEPHDTAQEFARSVHRLLSVDHGGFRGQHDQLTGGDLGVFALTVQ